MPMQRIGGLRRMAAMSSAATAAVFALAVPAAAHEPVLLDACDTVPQTSPLIPVGTDAIGFFGVLPQAGSDRAAQFTMKAGEQLNIGYGIPDLAPETQLATDDLPVVALVAPDLKVTLLQPNMRVPLHNPDFNQDYLFLNNYQTTAINGTYSLVMIGRAPSRIFVATGVEDTGFHGIQRGSLATDEQLTDWYTNGPTAPQASCTTAGYRLNTVSAG